MLGFSNVGMLALLRTQQQIRPGSEQKNSCILEQLAGGLFACLSGYWSFPVDLPDQVIEDLIDVNLGLCRRLQESTAVPLAGEILALFFPDHPLVFQIAFITHQDHRHVIRVFDPQNLFSQVLQVIEGGLCCYGVY